MKICPRLKTENSSQSFVTYEFSCAFLYIIANNIMNPLQCATANPDGRQRALVIGGGIANFTDVAATFNGIIRALKEKVSSFFWLFLFFSGHPFAVKHQLNLVFL